MLSLIASQLFVNYENQKGPWNIASYTPTVISNDKMEINIDWQNYEDYLYYFQQKYF